MDATQYYSWRARVLEAELAKAEAAPVVIMEIRVVQFIHKGYQASIMENPSLVGEGDTIPEALINLVEVMETGEEDEAGSRA